MHSLGFSQKLHYGAVSACCVKPAAGRNRDLTTANKPPVREAVKHIQLKVSVPEYMGLPQEPQAKAAAGSADMYVTAPYFIDDLVHGKASQHGAKTLVPLYAEDGGKVLFPAAVVQETIITDLLEAGREYMHHEPADEFTAGKGDLLQGRIVFVVFCHKGNGTSANRLYPGVGDGNAVCITPQIFNGIAETIKGLPDVRAPGGIIKPVL